jgi:NADPH:quinone reductase-like Zn-dependent oxidoreductase
VDYKVREGGLKFLSGTSFPKILGGDFSGEVEAVGKEIKTVAPGDQVYGMINPYKGGAYAEFLTCKETSIAKKPSKLTFEEAASLPIAALTALQGLRDHGSLAEHMSVLVNGSTGGVGSFAVQIAKAFKSRVTGVCSTKNIELLQKLGADSVIDYTKTDLKNLDSTYDLIFDAVSYMSVSLTRKLLKKGGAYVGTLPSPSKMIAYVWSLLAGSKKIKTIMVKNRKEDLEVLNDLIQKDALKPFLEKIYPFTEMAEAHRHVEDGHTRGKIVVKMQ